MRSILPGNKAGKCAARPHSDEPPSPLKEIGTVEKMHVAKDVDAYIKGAPKETRAQLTQLRKIIKSMAPDAEESISYRMPYYKYNGALVGFAAFKNHIGFFPGAIIHEFERELKGYQTAKGTIHFPIGKPLPVTLIRKLIKARIASNEART